MKFWSKIFLKSLFVTVVTSIALFFAHTSTYATTFWIFEQPRIPEKLLKK
jgi:cyclic lactone autoinducer peptide